MNFVTEAMGEYSWDGTNDHKACFELWFPTRIALCKPHSTVRCEYGFRLFPPLAVLPPPLSTLAVARNARCFGFPFVITGQLIGQILNLTKTPTYSWVTAEDLTHLRRRNKAQTLSRSAQHLNFPRRRVRPRRMWRLRHVRR